MALGAGSHGFEEKKSSDSLVTRNAAMAASARANSWSLQLQLLQEMSRHQIFSRKTTVSRKSYERHVSTNPTLL